MALLQVPTGSKNAPNRFPIKFYPKWYVRLPFSQKIFSENRKKRKIFSGRLRNPSRKKNRDLNRISLTLSNRASLTPALISFATPFIVSSEHCTFMHKVQLANGASHGHNSFPTHPSRRPLLHNFPIMGSPELSQC